jgi:hypothetical protein
MLMGGAASLPAPFSVQLPERGQYIFPAAARLFTAVRLGDIEAHINSAVFQLSTIFHAPFVTLVIYFLGFHDIDQEATGFAYKK